MADVQLGRKKIRQVNGVWEQYYDPNDSGPDQQLPSQPSQPSVSAPPSPGAPQPYTPPSGHVLKPGERGDEANDWMLPGSPIYTPGPVESAPYTPPTPAPRVTIPNRPNPVASTTQSTPAPSPTATGTPNYDAVNWAYQQYLGRGASQDEYQQYWAQRPDYDAGIFSSGEAQAYRAANNQGTGADGNLEYWAARGVPNSEIFDFNTGQLKPGWSRTAAGYARTGGTGQSGPTGAFNRDALRQAWIASGGRTVTDLRNFIAAHQGDFASGVTIGGSKGDKLFYNGQFLADVVISAGINGGQGAYWNEDTGSGGGSGGAGGTGGTGGTQTGIPGVDVSSYNAQFDDPSTRYLEDWAKARLNELGQPVNDPSRDALARLLDQLTAQFEQQRTAQEGENVKLRERQQQAQLSSEDLIAFLTKRAGTLQQDPYTGAEAEVLRTQALDPIENDRQAARQRALGRVSQRGMDPTSGIAQQLLNDTDAGFDRSRAVAQNDLAYRTINEKRSREQEAQSLLASIPDIQRAGMSGDLDFLQMLNAAVNQPAVSAAQTAGQSAGLGQTVRDEQQARRQEALAIATMLQQLPTSAMQQSLAAIGMAPNPESMVNQALQLYGIGQQNRNQGLSWYETLGAALPYLSGAFGGGRTTPTTYGSNSFGYGR